MSVGYMDAWKAMQRDNPGQWGTPSKRQWGTPSKRRIDASMQTIRELWSSADLLKLEEQQDELIDAAVSHAYEDIREWWRWLGIGVAVLLVGTFWLGYACG